VKLDRAALGAHALPPVIDGDKETKGRLLIVAGSREVPGAAVLAATAALRAGAGKVRIATGASVAPALGLLIPEAMVIGLAEDRDRGFAPASVKQVVEQAEKVDAIVAGPGMSRGGACAAIAAALLKSCASVAIDAALLHSLEPSGKSELAPVLLPHAGELASLLGCDEEEIEREPIRCGRLAAERYSAIVLVKGTVSHVVTPKGEAWTYEGGPPGLGVSGSGDVLAGIVGGLLARGAEPLNALLWTVWLHGEAGAKLAKKVGPIGFLARELPSAIPALLPR
jgi:ADP-dependent NAD(P)H-hydrate dehydratase